MAELLFLHSVMLCLLAFAVMMVAIVNYRLARAWRQFLRDRSTSVSCDRPTVSNDRGPFTSAEQVRIRAIVQEALNDQSRQGRLRP